MWAIPTYQTVFPHVTLEAIHATVWERDYYAGSHAYVHRYICEWYLSGKASILVVKFVLVLNFVSVQLLLSVATFLQVNNCLPFPS